MQLATAKNDSTIHSHGVLSSEKFTMDISGKAFRVLSSSLYQNKIGSIVREYSCNAMDAHTAAGKATVPFEIHLPNDYEPWFSVKDYGTGLSHDDIRTVYTCMFKSSKDTSNDAVGCFGLGSKSAFSYSDNFTVVSIFNGIKRSYSAIIQPNGEPSILELACAVTKESNGIEVSIAVNNNDFYKFSKEVAVQLRFLTVKPIIKNGNIEWNDNFIPTFSLCGFNIIKNDSYNPKTHVIQGGVGYPLDYALFTDAVKDEALMGFINLIRGEHEVHLHFNIGDIEVTPSRENISYNKSTKDNIMEKFKIAQKDMYTKFEKDIDALPNNWTRAEAILQLGRTGLALLKTNNKWGIPISGNFIAYELRKMLVAEHEVTVKKDTIDANGVVTSTSVKEKQFYTKYNLLRQSVIRVKIKSSSVETVKIETDNPVTIVYNDGAKYAPSRINLYADKNRHTSLYYLVSNNGMPITAGEAKLFTDFLGGKELTPLSALELPEREKRVRVVNGIEETITYKPAKLWMVNAGSKLDHSTRNWQKVTDTAIKNMDGGIYVVIKDRVVEFGYNMPFIQNVFDLMNVPLYAIREKDLHRIADNSAWVTFKVAYDEYIAKIKAKYKNKLVKFIISNYRHSVDSCLLSDKFMKHMYDKRNNVNDPALRKYVTAINRSVSNSNKNSGLLFTFITTIFENEIIPIKQKMYANMEANKLNLTKKYNLLNNFNTYSSADLDFVKHFIIYANAVHGA